MMQRLLIATVCLPFVLLLSGCTGLAPQAAPESPDGADGPFEGAEPIPPPAQLAAQPAVQTVPPAPTSSWEREGHVRLGWVAGLGNQAYIGQLTFGLTSHAQCPQAMFMVPDGVSQVEITFSPDIANASSAGVGTYKVVVSSPAMVHFKTPALGGPSNYTATDPVPGIWALKVEPVGVAVNQSWDFAVRVAGASSVAPVELSFQKDGECLA